MTFRLVFSREETLKGSLLPSLSSFTSALHLRIPSTIDGSSPPPPRCSLPGPHSHPRYPFHERVSLYPALAEDDDDDDPLRHCTLAGGNFPVVRTCPSNRGAYIPPALTSGFERDPRSDCYLRLESRRKARRAARENERIRDYFSREGEEKKRRIPPGESYFRENTRLPIKSPLAFPRDIDI